MKNRFKIPCDAIKKNMFKTHLQNTPEKKNSTNSHDLLIFIGKSKYKYIAYSNNIFYYSNRESINMWVFSLHRRQFFGYFQLREDVTVIEIFFEMFCSKKEGFFSSLL